LGTYKRLPRGKQKSPDEFRTFAEKVYIYFIKEWKKVALASGLVIALVVAIIAGYKYMNWRATNAFDALAKANAIEDPAERLKALTEVSDDFKGTAAARETMLILGKAAMSDGRTEEAVEWFDDLVSQSSRYAVLKAYGLQALGRAYEELGRNEDAAEAYGQAARTKGNLIQGQSRYDEARCLEKLGQLNKAEELYQTIIDNAGQEDVLLKAKSEERLLWLLASHQTEVAETE
jgi:tetratricopeptide (TPR) repeat protein